MSRLNPSAFSTSDKLGSLSVSSFIISGHKKINISPRISIIISHSYWLHRCYIWRIWFHHSDRQA